MSDEKLDSFVIMGVEKDILATISIEEIMNSLAESSGEMRRLFCLSV